MKILHNDRDILVCVKPAGVLSQEGKGANMPQMLKEETGCGEIYPVHRLDTAAAGLMVYAKNKRSAAALSKQIASGEFIKEYVCVVNGVPENSEGELRDLLFKDSSKNKSFIVSSPRRGVKEARLLYHVISSTNTPEGRLSLIGVRLITGRTHQIRVQFASRKMPLCGDGKYGARDNFKNLSLYSCRISFISPETGERMEFAGNPPEGEPWSFFSL